MSLCQWGHFPIERSESHSSATLIGDLSLVIVYWDDLEGHGIYYGEVMKLEYYAA